MPALPPVPSVLKLQFDFALGEDLFVRNRKFLQYAGTPPAASDCASIATAAAAAWVSHLAPLMTAGGTFNGCTATDLSSDTGAVGSGGVVTVGSRSGGALPAAIRLLEHGIISRRYRGGHPRVYWYLGSRNDMHDDQTWDSAFLVDANADLNVFNTALKAITYAGGTIANIVNVSFYKGFHAVTGSTGRTKDYATPRLAPVIDVIGSSLFQAGIALQRKSMLGLA